MTKEDAMTENATFITEYVVTVSSAEMPAGRRFGPRISAPGFREARVIAASLTIDGEPVTVVGQLCDGETLPEPGYA